MEKAANEDGVLNIKAVISTTNAIDSHMDMHIKGNWDKSVRENKRILLLQEHKNDFDHIIAYSKDVKASLVNTTFKALGFNIEGETQALVYSAKVREDVNPAMYKRYKNGNVSEHSVGMRYIKLELAINSEHENDKEEKAIWDEFSPLVANKEALERGYFWVVKEAKQIEGSAVPLGSNPFTPTMKEEEPPKGTQKQEPSFDTQSAIKQLNNLTSKI